MLKWKWSVITETNESCETGERERERERERDRDRVKEKERQREITVCFSRPLELLTPTGLGASGSRWTLQSMGMSLLVGILYSCPPQTLHVLNTNNYHND